MQVWPALSELAPRDAARGDVEVGAAVDDRRALAAELEGDRREVPGRGGHDDPADGPVARVEDVVPVLLEQGRGLGHAALDDRDGLRVEVARDEPGQRVRRRLGHLGRLDHRGVAGGERTDERREDELDRVVPRPDDQDDAERVAPDRRPPGQLLDRDVDLLGPEPPVEVAEREVDLGPDERDLGDEALDRGLAEVAAQRVDELGLALGQQPPERPELGPAPLDGPGAAGVEGRAEPLDGVGGGLVDAGDGRRSSSPQGTARSRTGSRTPRVGVGEGGRGGRRSGRRVEQRAEVQLALPRLGAGRQRGVEAQASRAGSARVWLKAWASASRPSSGAATAESTASLARRSADVGNDAIRRASRSTNGPISSAVSARLIQP